MSWWLLHLKKKNEPQGLERREMVSLYPDISPGQLDVLVPAAVFGLDCSRSGASLVTQEKRICVQCRRCRRLGFDPWAGKIPWKRARQPIPVFLPGETEEPGGLQSIGSQSWKRLKLLSMHMCSQCGWKTMTQSWGQLTDWRHSSLFADEGNSSHLMIKK